MKISVNDEHLFTLSETQKKVMQHVVHSEIFEDDMKRRLHWVLTHAYEVWFKQFKEEWESKLAERGIKMIPTDQEEFAELVFSQPDYKNRTQREEEIKLEKPTAENIT